MQLQESEMGTDWYCSYVCFCVGLNLSIAGGLELAHRMGRAHEEFESITKDRRFAKGTSDVTPLPISDDAITLVRPTPSRTITSG